MEEKEVKQVTNKSKATNSTTKKTSSSSLEAKSKTTAKKTTTKSADSSKKKSSSTKKSTPKVEEKNVDLVIEEKQEIKDQTIEINEIQETEDILQEPIIVENENNLEVSEEIVVLEQEDKEKKNKKKKEKDTWKFEKIEDVDVKKGLSSTEAEKRILNHYNNENNVKTTKTGWQIIRDNIFTFFNMLYIVITVILCLAHSWSNLTFLPIVLANVIISIYQEFKAKKIVEKLSLVSAPKATVIRDGEEVVIPTENVVIDDIIRYSNGNQIITDSIVKKGFIEVNESMITGEPDAILKQEGDMLYSGSFVVSGTCLAQVENVGKNNYIEKLAMEAKQQKENKSELLRTLNWIIKVIGFIIIPLAIFQFYQAWAAIDVAALAEKLEIAVSEVGYYEKFCEIIPSVAGSIIGMIPSGLFLLTTVALSAGVYRLAKRNNTMVQELYCIEMLARVDILCLDKTGTITDGTMRVVDCVEIKNTTDYTMREIVGSMMNSFEETNATSEALIRFFDKNKVLRPVRIIPFSSQRKFSAVAFEGVGTFYLGAPEYVFPHGVTNLKHRIDRYASQGCRVLLLSHTPLIIKGNELPKTVKPIGMIVLQDHIREDVFATLEYFRNNGVDIKVISGDNPLTVSEIASRAGILNTNRYVSLEGLTEEEVKDIAFDYTIFGRVTPNQKRALVEAYKEKKKTVAMTGDGVNDILALKEADCSIAMASGSEATRNIANIVLMESNFSAMPSVVAEGRRVINNIERTSTLFLVKTIFTILLTLFVMAMGIQYFYEPSQLIIIELCIIGAPSVFISLLPNNEKVQGKFIANVLRTSFPGALTVLLFNILLYVIGGKVANFGWFVEVNKVMVMTPLFKTMSLLITTAVCLTILYKMCKPFNLFKTLIFGVVLIIVITVFYFGLYQQDTTFGKMVVEFLKLDWPNPGPMPEIPIDPTAIPDMTYEQWQIVKQSQLINTLMLFLMILLINPVVSLMENLLGTIKKVKI